MDRLIIPNGKSSHNSEYQVSQQLSRDTSDIIGFQFWQLLYSLCVVIIMLLIPELISFHFPPEMKTEAVKATDIWQHLLSLATADAKSSIFWKLNKQLMSRISLSLAGVFFFFLVFVQKLGEQDKQIGTNIYDLGHLKTAKHGNKFLCLHQISTFRRVSIECWQQLVSLLKLETAVMTATCAVITSRAGNCKPRVLHLPQDSVHFLYKTGGRSWHSSALRA